VIVQLGNPRPINADADGVTYVSFPDDVAVADDIDVSDVLTQVFRGQLNLPGSDALLMIIAPNGIWKSHSLADAPSWVWSDNENLQNQIAAIYGCPVGEPVFPEDN
jgi:hypothetical protein